MQFYILIVTEKNETAIQHPNMYSFNLYQNFQIILDDIQKFEFVLRTYVLDNTTLKMQSAPIHL